MRQSLKNRKTPHPLTKDVIFWHIGSNVMFCFQEFQPKRRKSSEKRKNHIPGFCQELAKVLF